MIDKMTGYNGFSYTNHQSIWLLLFLTFFILLAIGVFFFNFTSFYLTSLIYTCAITVYIFPYIIFSIKTFIHIKQKVFDHLANKYLMEIVSTVSLATTSYSTLLLRENQCCLLRRLCLIIEVILLLICCFFISIVSILLICISIFFLFLISDMSSPLWLSILRCSLVVQLLEPWPRRHMFFVS